MIEFFETKPEGEFEFYGFYWGATNIEEYIPKDCFIDYRDFHSREDLYRFIKTMPKFVYEGYISRIKDYLQSEKARFFSPEYFDHIFYEAVTLQK